MAWVNRLHAIYGITLSQYVGLLSLQKGFCAICGEPEKTERNGKLKRLAVDHCHETGIIRGLLCQKCNTAIGSLDHNIEILNKAIEYLENYDENLLDKAGVEGARLGPNVEYKKRANE